MQVMKPPMPKSQGLRNGAPVIHNSWRKFMNRMCFGPPMRAALLVIVAVLAAGCAAPSAPAADALATFYPLAWATARIAGENVTVGTLVPAGVEPHDWEASARDVTRLAGAKVVLAQGAGFEPWLGGLIANLGDKAPRVVDTTAGFEFDEEDTHDDGDHEGVDPHTWLDPVQFAQQVVAIEDALATAFPEEAAGIRARSEALRGELATLASEFEAGLATCGTRVIVANHDAYGHLAHRYDFEVVAISGLSPEAEPSPQDLSRAIEAAREHNITIVFFEELVSPRVAEIVASEVGARTRVLSPIEGVSEADAAAGKDYLSLMRENLLGLREAMRCT